MYCLPPRKKVDLGCAILGFGAALVCCRIFYTEYVKLYFQECAYVFLGYRVYFTFLAASSAQKPLAYSSKAAWNTFPRANRTCTAL